MNIDNSRQTLGFLSPLPGGVKCFLSKGETVLPGRQEGGNCLPFLLPQGSLLLTQKQVVKLPFTWEEAGSDPHFSARQHTLIIMYSHHILIMVPYRLINMNV